MFGGFAAEGCVIARRIDNQLRRFSTLLALLPFSLLAPEALLARSKKDSRVFVHTHRPQCRDRTVGGDRIVRAQFFPTPRQKVERCL